MKTYIDFIFENSKESFDGQKFLTDCEPYIKEIKKNYNKEDFLNHGTLFRGFDKSREEQLIFNTNKTRTPVDTSKEHTTLADKLFFEKFGWKPRTEGVFASGNIQTADRYGDCYIFFPIGDYKFIFSYEIEDFYADVITTVNEKIDFKKLIKKFMKSKGLPEDEKKEREIFINMNTKNGDIEFEKFYRKEYNKTINKNIEYAVNTYTDTDNLHAAIFSYNEVIFKCDSYYLISEDKQKQIANLIFEK